MGFRFRKSIKLGGGFKINLSKSGIGYSFGGKGFRVAKTAKGKLRTTSSIHGTGLSYTKEFGVKNRTSQDKGKVAPVTYKSKDNAQKIENINIETRVSESSKEKVGENKIMKKCPVCGGIYNDNDQYCLKCNRKLQVIEMENYPSDPHFSEEQNIKKPFYKRKLFYLIAAAIIFFAFRLGTNNDSTNITENNSVGDEELGYQLTIGEKEDDKSIKYFMADNYTGPTCCMLYESDSVVEVYAAIDNRVDGWKEQCKMVFKMLKEEYEGYEDVIFKIYNSPEDLLGNQPDITNIIAVWQSNPYSYFTESKPTITWYPDGAGINAKQESEIWNP